MSEQPISPTPDPLSKVRSALYVAFELLVVFVGSAYVLAFVSGNTSSKGFSLQGWLAFAPFFITGVYYRVMKSYLGGTLSARGARWAKNRINKASSK